jgi:transcriptional regulator of acetoin/glycerol metabolism
MARLVAYSWPGNVRQLKNATLSALAIAGGGSIEPHHLIFEPASEPRTDSPTTFGGTVTIRELERQAIIQALRKRQGNHSQTARILGIDRSTLRRKMLEFGISDPPKGS